MTVIPTPRQFSEGRLVAGLRSIVAGVRRGWWWMASIALLVALGSAAAPTATPAAGPQPASAPVLIRNNDVTAPPAADEVAATMRAAAATAQVRADIAGRAGVTDPGRLTLWILPAGTDRIDVTATDADQGVAQRVARAARDAVIGAVMVDDRITRDASVAALRDQLAAAESALAASRKGSTDQQILQTQRDTLVRAIAAKAVDPGPILVAGPEPALRPRLPPHRPGHCRSPRPCWRCW